MQYFLSFILLINTAIVYSDTISLTPENQIETFKFNHNNSLEIVYQKFGVDKGRNGSIIISPGRTESSLKYSELAWDFIQKGYSPIYAINHQGQGFSERFFPDSHKGYIRKFEYYFQDFNYFVNEVLKDPEVDQENLYLVSHSMGGGIALGYLQAYPQNPFKKAVFSAPMFGMNLRGANKYSIIFQLVLGCSTPYIINCNDYIEGGKEYSLDKDRFEVNQVTSSSARFHHRKLLWTEIPELQLSDDPTYQWAKEALLANEKMKTKRMLRKIKKIPMLVFQAQNDTYVLNSSQNEVCKKLKDICTLVTIQGAKHEILMETDSIRDKSISEIFKFISKKSSDKD